MPAGTQDLAYAESKWERKAVAGNQRWHGDKSRYCKGLARYGVNEATCMSNIGESYNAGVSAPGAKERQLQGVQAAASIDKWSSDWLTSMNR